LFVLAHRVVPRVQQAAFLLDLLWKSYSVLEDSAASVSGSLLRCLPTTISKVPWAGSSIVVLASSVTAWLNRI